VLRLYTHNARALNVYTNAGIIDLKNCKDTGIT
jgi:hypothetical protein